MPNVTVVNHSKWPDGFLRVICQWVAKRAGITERYEFLWRSSQRVRGFSGRGGLYGCTITVHRRGLKAREEYTAKDHRFRWATPHTYVGPLEQCVYILAHEALHATAGRPRHFYKRHGTKRVDRAAMESRCNDFAMKTVEAFRGEWLRLRPKVKRELRRDKERTKKAKERKQVKRSPQHKLAQVFGNLARWEKKLRFAENKVKAYRRKVKYYNQRVAATQDPGES